MTLDINIKVPVPGRKAVKAGWRISPGFLRRVKAIAYEESPDWPIDSLETVESAVIAMIKLSKEMRQARIEAFPADSHDDEGEILMNHTSVPVEIDHENNVAYIVLEPKPPEATLRIELRRSGRSERFHNVVLDFDETGRLVGIELLDAAAVFGPRKPGL